MNFLLYIIGEKHQVSKNVSAFIIADKCGYGYTKMHLRILILFSPFRIFLFYSKFSTITVNMPCWFLYNILQIICYKNATNIGLQFKESF